jgi:nudix-type nucleoside diphosphatase (YffH/AdpP family)
MLIAGKGTDVATLIDLQTIYEGWTSFRIGSFRLDGGKIIKRELEDHGGAAAILPYDPERRCAMLVRQFRAGMLVGAQAQDVLEVIAGILDAEEPAACAQREAFEEAGLRLGHLEPLGIAFTMPGISTETLHMFLATYSRADRVSDGGGLAHEDEHITVVEMPLSNLAEMVDARKLHDLKTLYLLQTLRLRSPELF